MPVVSEHRGCLFTPTTVSLDSICERLRRLRHPRVRELRASLKSTSAVLDSAKPYGERHTERHTHPGSRCAGTC